MRRLSVLVPAMSVFLLLATAAVAQDAGPGAQASVVDSVESAGASTVPASAAAPTSGLPEQPAPPRTLRAHWHVFVAFAIAWVLLFGYALSLGRRFAGLEAEVRRLGGMQGG